MKTLKQIWASKMVRFAVVTIIYLLWFVVWTENLWWLLGVAVIYDYYYSRLIDKIFLNKYRALKAKHRVAKVVFEWVEALLFAVVVVVPLKLYLFGLYVIPSSSMEMTLVEGDYIVVNRLAYGPKMPNTPLAIPFVQHTMPFTSETPSFLDWIQCDYKRLKGYSQIANMDVVVFNFPAGDTVGLQWPNSTYYDIISSKGRAFVEQNSTVVYRPVDKRENYIKRCVAVAGDSLYFADQTLFVNGRQVREPAGVQYDYVVQYAMSSGTNLLTLTLDQVARLRYDGSIVEGAIYQFDSLTLFPHRPDLYAWTKDNYGPLWVPQRGATVALDLSSLPLYERIIKNYEGNSLEVKGDVILINGEPATSYTFKMDYYFMMGDNRDNSADSRFWGFVPEDHIEGIASFIWLSIQPGENIFTGIRWSRLFNSID